MQEDWRDRCDWCHWPLKESRSDGCVVDDCSMRPMPKLDEAGELRQLVRKLEADNGWLKHKLGAARVAIATEIEVSNCTYEYVDGLDIHPHDDKEVLLSMVCVPGLKDAMRLLEGTPDKAPRLTPVQNPTEGSEGL